MKKKFTKNTNKGIITTLVLVFGVIFLILLSGLSRFILMQLKQSQEKVAWEATFQIAEAGVNYYRWHLNHNRNDIQDGQSWCCAVPPCDVCGPYEHDFYDFQGQLIGKFSLEIQPKIVCDEILGVYVSSTGWTNQLPNLKRKVRVKYASTSIAEYSYLLDEAVWAGGDRQIYGKYHSNAGIRMDGTHNSLVTSAAGQWLCTSSFGCDWQNCPDGCSAEGNACLCPGVFGAGGPQDLWEFPVPPFDFSGLTADLFQMKNLAQAKGKYYPPSTDLNPGGKGYHLIFKNNGTFDLKIVTNLGRVRGYSIEEGWHWDYHIIQDEVDYQLNVALPEGCGLIFLEDNLWIEGTLKGRTTVASANLIDPFKDTGVVLNGSIDYTVLDGSDSLALITEEDILIPLYSPDNMVATGIFVAQKGRSLSRNHYSCTRYPVDCKKNTLIIYGSVVSKGRVGTKWVYSGGAWASGYNQRYDYFDQRLATEPPPLLPYVSEELQFISWEEIQ